MDGRNSAGRKISLLNDSSDVAACGIPPSVSINTSSIANTSIANTTTSSTSSTSSKFQLPPLSAHLHQHQQQRFVHGHPRPALHHAHASSSHSHHSHDSSSRSTSPCLSPQTPVLSRSSSSDSRAFQTPSPVTPSFEPSFTSKHHSAGPHLRYPHHQHSQSQHHRQQYFLLNNSSSTKMDDPSLYPPLPDLATAQAPGFGLTPTLTPQMPALPLQQSAHRSSNSPGSEPSRVSTVSAASNSKAQPKKNQYPCPLAKQYNCSDFFTTSGHAARHAKKHTGKKDAFCPECNKAFTRKDNMEQHRRTHQNGRGASRTSGSSDDSKIKKSTKPAPKKPVKAEPAFEAAVEQQLAEQQHAEQQSQQTQPQMPIMQAQMQPQQPQSLQQAQAQHPNTDPAILIPPVGGPYFLNNVDSGPIHSLPMPAVNESAIRPALSRNVYGQNSLDYFPPPAQMLGELDSLNFSYPSPGLSNGLNSLALAASEHRRLSEEKTAKSPSSDGPTP